MSLFSANQLILITGASSGIGRAIALRVHAEGATVIAHGRDEVRLASLQERVTQRERMCTERRDLLQDMEHLPNWMSDLCKKYGRLSGLVCAAGITWNSPMSYYPLEKAHEIFDINCHAPLILGGTFCNKRNNTGPGSAVVYISAAASVAPNPGQGMYGASKGALVAAARCQAREAAPAGVRVNCISPGLVKTPMADTTVRQLGQAFVEREEACYPLGFGKAEDVASLTVFLLSKEASWMTGQNILLTGGR